MVDNVRPMTFFIEQATTNTKIPDHLQNFNRFHLQNPLSRKFLALKFVHVKSF